MNNYKMENVFSFASFYGDADFKNFKLVNKLKDRVAFHA